MIVGLSDSRLCKEGKRTITRWGWHSSQDAMGRDKAVEGDQDTMSVVVDMHNVLSAQS
jgi:hypothetical protein